MCSNYSDRQLKPRSSPGVSVPLRRVGKVEVRLLIDVTQVKEHRELGNYKGEDRNWDENGQLRVTVSPKTGRNTCREKKKEREQAGESACVCLCVRIFASKVYTCRWRRKESGLRGASWKQFKEGSRTTSEDFVMPVFAQELSGEVLLRTKTFVYPCFLLSLTMKK